MNAILFALGLLAATTSTPVAAGRMGATPVAAGAPHFVQLISFQGLPPDSSIRLEFMEAFRGVFAEDQLKSEHGGDGGWTASSALPNRFRLLEGSLADDVWTLQVVIGAPASARGPLKVNPKPGEPRRRPDTSRRSSRGMIVSFTTLSPEAIRNGARAMARTSAFAFPPPPPPVDASQPVSSSGFRYSWAAAGTAAGLLALETLHHDSSDLREDERFDIAPAVRVETGL